MIKSNTLVRVIVSLVICTFVSIPVFALNSNFGPVSIMSKEDVEKNYHSYFDLNDKQKAELIVRGYNEKEIAKLDRDDFERLERTWTITDAQKFYIKGTYTELQNVDISTWTNADVQAHIASVNNKQRLALEPNTEQVAELEKRGISLDMAHKMLRDYIDYGTLLSQPDNVLNDINKKIIEDDKAGKDFLDYMKAVKENYKLNLL